jgi:predicted transcriptional regulator
METVNIPQSIKDVRRSLGIPQKQLAKMIGSTRFRIADYETNRSRISAEVWLKILALQPHNTILETLGEQIKIGGQPER